MRTLCLMLTSLLLISCSSQPADTHEYLLRHAEVYTAPDTAPVVRLSKVEVASYLDQNGIVLLTGAAEINGARQHLWAESLSRSIRRYLQVAIGAAAGVNVEVSPLTTKEPLSEIEIRIHQLHGSLDGKVILVAEWSLTGTDREARLYQFNASRQQSTDGYAALVDTHAALLDELAEAIAQQLNEAS